MAWGDKKYVGLQWQDELGDDGNGQLEGRRNEIYRGGSMFTPVYG